MTLRKFIISGIFALSGLLILSSSWVIMQLDHNYLWLRWLCFGGWVIAILGVALKLSYIESIRQYEKIWLMGYVSFGICLLDGVVSELDLGINLPLFDIGWYMMGATIVIGFIIGIEQQISNR